MVETLVLCRYFQKRLPDHRAIEEIHYVVQVIIKWFGGAYGATLTQSINIYGTDGISVSSSRVKLALRNSTESIFKFHLVSRLRMREAIALIL